VEKFEWLPQLQTAVESARDGETVVVVDTQARSSVSFIQ